jgi:hypothetical protein
VNLAFWHVAPGRAELREAPEPDGEVVVRALVSGISRGTERLVHRGRVPPSQHAAMRCPLQEGEFGFPREIRLRRRGRRGSDGPAGVLPAPPPGAFRRARAFLHPHPGWRADARAALGANMETALNILWDAAPLLGERALVIGAASSGCSAPSCWRGCRAWR